MTPHWQWRSNFETLLDDLFANTDPFDLAPKAHPVSIDTLEAAWELAADHYAPTSNDRVDVDLQHIPPTYGAREDLSVALLDPSKIVSELGLQPGASDADRTALKREFALRNHPDRVPEELRDLANQRMMVANDLIDQYVAALRKSGRG